LQPYVGITQSASEPHIVLHAAIVPPPPTEQTYAPQALPIEFTLQLPVALQVVFEGALLTQAPAHGVPDVANRQAWAVPLQPPGVQAASFPEPAGHTERGSCPVGTSEQVPFDVPSAQYWQVPAQAVSQHTPSTQCGLESVPFWQSALVVHIEPSGFFPHEVPLQTFPAEHWFPPDVHDG